MTEALPSEPSPPAGPPRISIWKTGGFLTILLASALLPWVHTPLGVSYRRRWLYEPEAWPLRLIWTVAVLWLAYKVLPHLVVAVLRTAPVSTRGQAVVVHGFNEFVIQPEEFAGYDDQKQSILVRTVSGRSVRIPTWFFNDHKFWHPKIAQLLDERLCGEQPPMREPID